MEAASGRCASKQVEIDLGSAPPRSFPQTQCKQTEPTAQRAAADSEHRTFNVERPRAVPASAGNRDVQFDQPADLVRAEGGEGAGWVRVAGGELVCLGNKSVASF
jgi:hypothetical protein